MSDFRDMARVPKHPRRFEKLLYLAVQRGDADLVAERLSWNLVDIPSGLGSNNSGERKNSPDRQKTNGGSARDAHGWRR